MEAKALEEAKLYMRVSDDALLYSPNGSMETYSPRSSSGFSTELGFGPRE
jgi:hypothetical protein